jgi:hypothetical protein
MKPKTGWSTTLPENYDTDYFTKYVVNLDPNPNEPDVHMRGGNVRTEPAFRLGAFNRSRIDKGQNWEWMLQSDYYAKKEVQPSLLDDTDTAELNALRAWRTKILASVYESVEKLKTVLAPL